MQIKNWHKVGRDRSAVVAEIGTVTAQVHGAQPVVRLAINKAVRGGQGPLDVQRLVVEMTLEEAVDLAQRMRQQVHAHSGVAFVARLTGEAGGDGRGVDEARHLLVD